MVCAAQYALAKARAHLKHLTVRHMQELVAALRHLGTRKPQQLSAHYIMFAEQINLPGLASNVEINRSFSSCFDRLCNSAHLGTSPFLT